jgi:hypothetical protein
MNQSIIKIQTNFSNNSSVVMNNISSFVNNSITNDTQNATALIFNIDPNWFYSTSAQSAAAIVGLMGALIVTKLINEKSIYKQIKREINEFELKIKSINDEIKFKKEWLENVDIREDITLVKKFLRSQLSLIDPENPPNIEELYSDAVSEDDYKDINKAILKEEYNSGYLAVVQEYNKEQSKIPKILRTSVPGLLSVSELNSIDLIKYNQYKNDIDKQQTEISLYEILLEDKSKHLRAQEELPTLFISILSLFAFSILGVFLPLFMMLLDYNTMMHHRFNTFLSILFGWIFVLGFFLGEFYQLFRISK